MSNPICVCGCGRTLKANSNGIMPRFAHGHNRRLHRGAFSAPPSGICECGCGGRTAVSTQTRLNAIKGQRSRRLPGHHRLRMDQLFEKVASGCWEWKRSIGSHGYGFATGGLAHRIIYERLIGPIAAGMQLDHLCRNRRCVNPAHLEVVTPAENTRRSIIVREINFKKSGRTRRNCKEEHHAPESEEARGQREASEDVPVRTSR